MKILLRLTFYSHIPPTLNLVIGFFTSRDYLLKNRWADKLTDWRSLSLVSIRDQFDEFLFDDTPIPGNLILQSIKNEAASLLARVCYRDQCGLCYNAISTLKVVLLYFGVLHFVNFSDRVILYGNNFFKERATVIAVGNLRLSGCVFESRPSA